MNFNEKLDMKKSKGEVSLVIKRNGKIINEEMHNLILDKAEDITAGLLAGDSSFEINSVIVGDDNTAITSTATTVLAGHTFTTTDVTKSVSGNVATFVFKLSTSEFNGYDIWQFGLSTGSGVLFSAVSRNPSKTYPIEKDSEVSIEGTWKITVEV